MSSSLPVFLALFFSRECAKIAFLLGLFMCCLSLPLTIIFLDGAYDSKIFKKRVSKYEYAAVKEQEINKIN